MYLSFPQVYSLLTEVSTLTVAGSWLGLDLLNVKGISITGNSFQGYWQSGFDNPEELASYG